MKVCRCATFYTSIVKYDIDFKKIETHLFMQFLQLHNDPRLFMKNYICCLLLKFYYDSVTTTCITYCSV